MKKLMILTTTFYPHPTVASVRMTQFAKYFPEHGFYPIIICKNYGYYAKQDQVERDVNFNVQIYRLGKKNSTKHYYGNGQNRKNKSFKKKLEKKINSIKTSIQNFLLNKGFGGLFVPSHSIIFWKKHKKHILNIVSKEQPDIIMSSSPQHAMHWVGKIIKSRYPGIIWIADFRDPYIIDKRYAPFGISKFMLPLHRRFERSIYFKADLITHAIPLHARWARYVYPGVRGKIYTLPNGIPESLINFIKTNNQKNNTVFTISSVGRIDDDNANKLAIMATFLNRDGYNVKLCFVGKKPQLSKKLINELNDRIELTGSVSHDVALSMIVDSDLLVSCLTEEIAKTYGLSSKLFEYLATGKPILSINPTHPDRELAIEFQNIITLENPTVNVLYKTVLEIMLNNVSLSEFDLEKIYKQFNRRLQVADLVQIINKKLDSTYCY